MTELEELAELEALLKLREGLARRAKRCHGRKSMHPLTALFLALAIPPRTGMKLVAERGGLIYERRGPSPDVDEVSWAEVIAIFEAAKARLNPAWCDVWVSSIKSKVQNS